MTATRPSASPVGGAGGGFEESAGGGRDLGFGCVSKGSRRGPQIVLFSPQEKNSSKSMRAHVPIRRQLATRLTRKSSRDDPTGERESPASCENRSRECAQTSPKNVRKNEYSNGDLLTNDERGTIHACLRAPSVHRRLRSCSFGDGGAFRNGSSTSVRHRAAPCRRRRRRPSARQRRA